MRICSQPRRHPHRNSIQIHGLELMSPSVLYGFRKLRVVLGTRILHAACSVHHSLSPLDCSMPIVQIASKALRDANDAPLGVHYITRITKPHVHCFLTLALERSPPRSSSFTLSKGPPQRPPPHTPLAHFVRPKSSSLAYRLAFVIYIYIYVHIYIYKDSGPQRSVLLCKVEFVRITKESNHSRKMRVKTSLLFPSLG